MRAVRVRGDERGARRRARRAASAASAARALRGLLGLLGFAVGVVVITDYARLALRSALQKVLPADKPIAVSTEGPQRRSRRVTMFHSGEAEYVKQATEFPLP